MPPYETPAALRAALDARLASRSRETNTDPERLRRRAVFERLLVRLILVEPDQWILKGGMALEVRLGDKARATKDLDLALRDAGVDGNAVRERLIDCLGHDPEEDWFDEMALEVDGLEQRGLVRTGEPGGTPKRQGIPFSSAGALAVSDLTLTAPGKRLYELMSLRDIPPESRRSVLDHHLE